MYFFFIQFAQISETALLFATFSRFARLSFWKKQNVDKDEYGALLVKTKINLNYSYI
jgi:hypothetical protein